jgi:hypothetical protein
MGPHGELSPDDVDDLWHALIERNRRDDQSFDGHITLDLAFVLMASTNADQPHSSPERMLLRLREWYGPRVERLSVLAVMVTVQVG